MKLDLLTHLEQLLEGVGEASAMATRSLLLAPLYFFSATPIERIDRGIATKRLLPPLLFLASAAMLYVSLWSFVTEVGSFKPPGFMSEQLTRLREGGAVDFALTVAPVVAAIWLLAWLASSLLAPMSALPQRAIQSTFIYWGALLLCGEVLAIATILASVYRPDLHQALLPDWLSEWVFRLLRIGGVALVVALSWHCGRAVYRHQANRGRALRTGAALLGAALPAALPLADDPLVTAFMSFTDKPMQLRQLTEGERLLVVFDEQHCDVDTIQFSCVVVVHPLVNRDLLFVAIIEPSLWRSSGADKGSTRAPLSAVHIETVPPIGMGQSLRLKGGEQAPLGVRVPVTDLCRALLRSDSGVQAPGSTWIQFDLLGYALRTRHEDVGFERYRVNHVPLSAAQLNAIIAQCLTLPVK